MAEDQPRTAAWVTVHEVLEQTGLPYQRLMLLAERGLIGSRTSGGATLYDAYDVTLIARAAGHPDHRPA
jgi:DNA-binding transcriptional MerR regulator